MLSNTSHKPHVLEKSGSGCTVMARPLFRDLVVFWLFLCDTTLWQSDAVVWTTWNLVRMYRRYSYLKLKKKISNFFSKNFFNFPKKNFKINAKLDKKITTGFQEHFDRSRWEEFNNTILRFGWPILKVMDIFWKCLDLSPFPRLNVAPSEVNLLPLNTRLSKSLD